MRGWRTIAGAVTAVVALAGCVSPQAVDGAQPATTEQAPRTVSTELGQGDNPTRPLVEVACDRDFDPAGVLADLLAESSEDGAALCGVLVVPEDRADPLSPDLELAFLQLPARPVDDGAPVNRAPLLVLSDGPGASGIDELALLGDSPLRDGRDVVLVDLRGTGRSFPLLDCGRPPRLGAVPADLVTDCRQALLDEGVRLEAYDAAAMAADVDDLRRALAVGRWAVLGIGHGARVALTLLRDRPEAVRSMVLDSPIPLEVDLYAERPAVAQAALNRLFDACSLDDACTNAFGDLRPAVERTLRRLDTAPFEPDEGPTVTGADLALAAMSAMQGTLGPAIVPAALATAVDGDPDEALQTLLEVGVGPRSFSEGVLLSASCREEVPFTTGPMEDDDALGAVGQALVEEVRQLIAACSVWDVAPAEARENDPVGGTIPTLVLTGEFDPFVAPAWGGMVASRLDRAQVVEVAGAGHRVVDADDCTLAIVAAFLARPREPVEDDCAADRAIDFDLG